MNRVQRPSYLRQYCVCCDVAHASLRSRRNFKLKVPARMDHVLMFMYLVVGRQAVHFELPRRRRSFPSSSASNLRGIKYFADTYVFADLSDPLKRELVVIRTGYCAKPPVGKTIILRHGLRSSQGIMERGRGPRWCTAQLECLPKLAHGAFV